MPATRSGVSTYLTIEEKKKIEDDVIARLIQEAVSQKVVTKEDDLVIRDIMPNTDLGLTNEYWAEVLATPNAWNAAIINVTLPKDKIIAFYGVKNKAAVMLSSMVRFNLAQAKVKDIWEVEDIQTELNAEALAETPVLYNNSEVIRIDMYCMGLAGTDELMLIGKVAEPKGKLISP